MKEDTKYILGFITIAVIFIGGLAMTAESERELYHPTINTETIELNIEELIEQKLQEHERYGYANGVIMPARALGEAKFFKSMGWEYSTCEEIVHEMYEDSKYDAIHEPSPLIYK